MYKFNNVFKIKNIFLLLLLLLINNSIYAEQILIQDLNENYEKIYDEEIINNKDNINKIQTLPVKVFFTPWDNAEQEVINCINQAKHNIYIQTHLWNSKFITDAVLNAKKRNISIYILADKDQMLSSKNSQIRRLINAGITIKLEVKYQNANNRVIIIDYDTNLATLLTGSYDFNYRSQHTNSENLLIIKNKNLAKTYYDNWQRHNKKSVIY